MIRLILFGLVWAQAPEILRFIPGSYREGAIHQVDLYNPTDRPLSLGNWLLVTREYSVRLPYSLTLAPHQRIRIAKIRGDVRLDRYPDFLIRFPQESQPGAYVALIDDQGHVRRGLYLAPLPQVLFLPDSGVNITRDGRRIPFYLPSETAPVWEYVPWEPDPITGVVRIGGTWRYTVADEEREARLYAPLRFLPLIANYEKGVVHLSWALEVRERCTAYRLERAELGGIWQTIAVFPCPSLSRAPQRVEYYDLNVREGKSYRYRLVYEELPSFRVTSTPADIQCFRQRPPLDMSAQAGYLRLWVAQSQPLKVRLLDQYFTEVLRIYDGWVNGGVENVFVWDTTRIRAGKWIVVWTTGKRYWVALR
ncbi:MAG: hypothetical protein ABDH66_01445 [Bacteroidia bacterium]